MGKGRSDGRFPLFETREAAGKIAHRVYAICEFVGICMLWLYRATNIPRQGEVGKWLWIGMFAAELWFGFYWVITQLVRWNRIYRLTFKDRLAHRFEEELPGVDAFVCTADPVMEPPIIAVNTVLSLMAYDYPAEKLSVYVSDDGGSDLTFYAVLEASRFSEHWIPFCNKFKAEPRSPAAYFSTISKPPNHSTEAEIQEWETVKRMYEDMEERIDSACRVGRIREEVRQTHKGFAEWASDFTRRNHQPIVQILIDGRRDPSAADNEGVKLPTLVYVSREKRPQYPHNFKAGAMNALIRVSSEISNGAIILNVDCDMYSNNSEAVRDALCFFMDEEKGHQIAFVQYPQCFSNITKNDLYYASLALLGEVDLHGMDGTGGPMYIGTGCFHRRKTLRGRRYDPKTKVELTKPMERKANESLQDLEDRGKQLATCKYEENTQWGNEMGVKYGSLVEDVTTGLAIHCRDWRSVYFNPERKGFVGSPTTTLEQVLVQQKRWAEGDLQILWSRHSPFVQGYGKIPLQLRLAYCLNLFWALNSLPTLYYVIVPPLCLCNGISLFPTMNSPWFALFMSVIIVGHAYGILEALSIGMTLQAWWNERRITLMKRTTSYLFALTDNLLRLLGMSNTAFVITAKVAADDDDDFSKRHKQELMEFGSDSPMFTILATLAMLNLISLLYGLIRLIIAADGGGIGMVGPLALQVFTCAAFVLINLPVYQGLFFRKDKGRFPASVAIKSVLISMSAISAFYVPIY
ncbi:hypothetical protein ACLOJK_031024 [Asimina triloba]